MKVQPGLELNEIRPTLEAGSIQSLTAIARRSNKSTSLLPLREIGI